MTAQLTLVRGAVLVARNSLVKTRRSTDEDLDILLGRSRDNSLQKLLSNESLALRPVLRRLVQNVESAEAVGVLVLEVLELLLEQDVVGGDVTKDEGDLGLVLGVLEDGAGELVHGGDAGATSDEGDVVVLVGLPGVLGDGALHLERLAGGHVVHVLGHDATGVALDDEVEVAGLVLVGDGGVRANSRLLHLGALVLGDEGGGDVEARDGIVVVELEAQLLGVVVDQLHGLERQADEALVAAGEALDGAVAGLVGHVGLFCARGRRVGLGCAASGVPVSCAKGGDTGGTVDQAIVTCGLGGFGGVVADVLGDGGLGGGLV